MTATAYPPGPAPALDDTAAGGPTHARGVALGDGEQLGAYAVVVLVAVLGLIGAVNSFARVAEAVEPSFGPLAWTVPLGIDVGIAVFTGLDLVMARLGMRLRWLRLVPWALVATTIYLNVAGEHDPIGMVAHAVLPALWVVAVEAGGHVLRSWAGLATPDDGRRRRLDRVRGSRWALAPLSTVRLWRRMVLWETPSYTDALRRERDRLLVRTDLEDNYGRVSWRWQAPRRERVLYRLGELAPATALPAEAAPEPTGAEAVPPPAGELPPGPAPARRRRPASTTRHSAAGGSTTATASDDELLAAGREVAAELAAASDPLTRDALAAALRARGLRVGTARATELAARLKAETTEGSAV